MFFPTTFPGSSVPSLQEGDGAGLSPRSTLLFPPPGLAPSVFLSPFSALSKANPDTSPAVPTPDSACSHARPPSRGPFHCQQAQPGAGKEQPSHEHGHPSSCAPPKTLILTHTRGMSPWHQEARAGQPLASAGRQKHSARGQSGDGRERASSTRSKIGRAWSTTEHRELLPSPQHCSSSGLAAQTQHSVPFIRPGDLVVGILGLQLLCGHSVVSSSKSLQRKEGSQGELVGDHLQGSPASSQGSSGRPQQQRGHTACANPSMAAPCDSS